MKKKKSRTKQEQIHYTMSRIKGKDTKIEIALRLALYRKGIRYRKNCRFLPGKPDVALTGPMIAIFCDGEFWHGKDWDVKKYDFKTNKGYWVEKIERNIRRDAEVDRQLRGLGWRVLRFWGEDIKGNLDACLLTIDETITLVKTDGVDFA